MVYRSLDEARVLSGSELYFGRGEIRSYNQNGELSRFRFVSVASTSGFSETGRLADYFGRSGVRKGFNQDRNATYNATCSPTSPTLISTALIQPFRPFCGAPIKPRVVGFWLLGYERASLSTPDHGSSLSRWIAGI